MWGRFHPLSDFSKFFCLHPEKHLFGNFLNDPGVPRTYLGNAIKSGDIWNGLSVLNNVYLILGGGIQFCLVFFVYYLVIFFHKKKSQQLLKY